MRTFAVTRRVYHPLSLSFSPASLRASVTSRSSSRDDDAASFAEQKQTTLESEIAAATCVQEADSLNTQAHLCDHRQVLSMSHHVDKGETPADALEPQWPDHSSRKRDVPVFPAALLSQECALTTLRLQGCVCARGAADSLSAREPETRLRTADNYLRNARHL